MTDIQTYTDRPRAVTSVAIGAESLLLSFRLVMMITLPRIKSLADDLGELINSQMQQLAASCPLSVCDVSGIKTSRRL